MNKEEAKNAVIEAIAHLLTCDAQGTRELRNRLQMAAQWVDNAPARK